MAGPAPTPSGVCRIVHQTSGVLSRWEIAYTGGPPTTAGLTSIAAAARSSFSAHLAAMLSSSWGMTNTFAYDLANPSTPYGEDLTEVVGTRAGNAIPFNICANINFAVNRRYRGSKPKIFLPFGTESDQLNSKQWSTTFITALNSAWNAYVAALSGTSVGGVTLGSQVAVSYYSGKTTNPNPNSKYRFVSTPRGTPLVMSVVSIGGAQTFGSQRKRLRGT